MATELELALILCTTLFGGQVEVRHSYEVLSESRFVRIDCETETEVIEVGLDGKRGSFDSLHQAVFAADLTGKRPVVVIIDTNRHEDRFEYQIETVARAMGVAYRTYDADYLLRWQMTWPFRQRRDQTAARYGASIPLN